MVFEIVLHKVFLALIQIEAAQQEDVVFAQLRHDLFFQNAAEFLLLPVDDVLNFAHHHFGRGFEFAFGFFAYAQEVALVGHAHAEKFVEVGGVNSQKLDAFKQGHSGVHRFLKHAVIER